MSFLKKLQSAYASALASGALHPINTQSETLEEAGIHFQVRKVINLERKAKEAQTRPADFNPFLPYDPAMVICDAGDNHIWLLNKYNVLPDHALLVTREYEPQLSPLNTSDFLPVCQVLLKHGGLAFYNAGPEAGASVKHKHLQWIPVTAEPLISNALPLASTQQQIETDGSAEEWAKQLESQYQNLLANLKLIPTLQRPVTELLPYNLLLTRDCLWLVPRTREHAAGISFNALAFAGSLLVKNEDQLRILREVGPLTLLHSVVT